MTSNSLPSTVESQQSIWTKRFWTDTMERTIRTGGQVALAAFGAPAVLDAVKSGDFGSVPWETSLILVIVSMVLTVLTCLVGKSTGDPSTASLTSGTGKNIYQS